ncbi:MAG: OmpA family protein [Gammaproteobacteria bacterium]|nr:OmpA family protein [Gammaproteobacteria bacterium]
MQTYHKILVSILALTLVGCATDDPNRRAKTGAAIGALTGAVLGHQINHKSGRFVGAIAGAALGGMTGDYMDKQQQDFERELEQEQVNHDIQIRRLENENLKIDISSEVSFDFNKTVINPSFQVPLNKVAAILNKYNQTNITVIGHTDSIGSEQYNLSLSEKRARSVVNYLIEQGVSPYRLKAIGMGEQSPRATNQTEAGRQLNRRVEILIKPIK